MAAAIKRRSPITLKRRLKTRRRLPANASVVAAKKRPRHANPDMAGRAMTADGNAAAGDTDPHAGKHVDASTSAAGNPSGQRNRKRRRRRKSHAKGPLGPDGFKQAAKASGGPTEKRPNTRPSSETHEHAATNLSAKQSAATRDAQTSGNNTRPDAPHDQKGQRFSGPSLYAALDLGTNNCRLLIAQPTRSNQFRVVDGFSRIVRLGEGLAATGSLSPDAMDRAIEALGMCAAKLKGRAVKRMRLIATEACRAADNGDAFLERVQAETGLELEVINRETEARLAVSSCASLIGHETRAAVLFDIGGGSSEIAVIRVGENRSRHLANHISHWTSLPVGVVTLSERFGGHDVTPDVFEAMVSEVEALLGDFKCPAFECSAQNDGFHLIGTSGTVTTLAGVHLNLPRYDRRKVDGIWLTNDEVSAMQSKLLSWDFAGRAANPCIGPDRADLVLAGCAILEAIRRRWPAPRMRVADRGLREGILTDMMMRDGVWRRPRRRGGFGRPPQQARQNTRD